MTCTPREIITRPPSRRRGESAADYRERLAEWERDRLQANASGYRQISLPPGVSPMGRALLVSIAALSYAQGFEYHPIELSERAVAALLRLKNSRANHQARSVLAELLAIGILVVVEPARGRRPGQYRLDVAPYVSTGGRARGVNGHKAEKRPLSTGASSPARPDRKKQRKRKEGQPSAPPAPARPMGAESGGAPPGSTTANRPVSLPAYLASLPDDERKQRGQERAEPEAARKAEHEAFERALQALPPSESEALKAEARKLLGAFYLGDDSPAFDGVFRSLVMDHTGSPVAATQPESLSPCPPPSSSCSTRAAS